ncbi:protein arginine N-methyltransferase 5 [Thecamonas trahens ATCC 50062]|uniref:Protein arginine N-methyltransferase n=1 Tax=Thecamonas trahens ATCC 50062 TaxID=461836 RepID=A0A0L0D242_THETB|nr:protein arginine N-methyltransferase 5 [Thecamonas trahens ATCC 50062]KNC46185.1 protein arginine N-methyltransferase 5 [Thecamonas trahens ATCC 50062]|eukprot:XP_013763160.1 protein arginine N-methyltransferase 5 [Thecamonas trahens ATCC 50062]
MSDSQDAGRSVTLGLMCGGNGKVEDAQVALDDAIEAGYSFMVTQLVRYPRAGGKGSGASSSRSSSGGVVSAAVPEGLTHSDLVLRDLQNANCFVGIIGDWLDLAYSGAQVGGEDVKHSAAELKRELEWAIYLGLPAVLLNSLPDSASALAHLAMLTVDSFHTIQLQFRNLWVRLSVDSNEDLRKFATFLTLAAPVSSFVGVLLELTPELPDAGMLARWRGEPVRGVLVPTSLFVKNKAGYPVLLRAHQAFVKSMIEIGAQIIVQTTDGTPASEAAAYAEYVEHLASTMEPSPVGGYEDELQAPLQPLQDNLESTTYETFERDAPKYKLYRKAVRRALADLPDNLSVPGQEPKAPYVVMVLGGGRGPLVAASLAAAVEAGRAIKVYCVEKNPSALLTLQMRAEAEWGGLVEVIGSDMRAWQPTELADIIVSELLGSFGDNELSPECLDGAQRLLKPGGISIPASYTSYAAPISAHKLHTELQRTTSSSPSVEINMQTPYVVYFSNVHVLDAPLPVFTFDHPNADIAAGGMADNTRFTSLSFTLPHDATIHGFAGYFDCVLYKDVVMSINPESHTPDMYSWFPIYFPILEPIHGKAGEPVELHIWRKTTTSKVWYEWAFTSPVPTRVHNPKGTSSHIGL